MTAVAIAASVLFVVLGSLAGLRMVLAHKSKALEHAPLVKMQAKLDELEQRLVSGAMRR